MAYSQQSFAVSEKLLASKMNQIELNIRDHVHGEANVSNTIAAYAYRASGSQTSSGDTTGIHTVQCMSTSIINNGFSLSSGHVMSVNSRGSYYVSAHCEVFEQVSHSAVELYVMVNSNKVAQTVTKIPYSFQPYTMSVFQTLSLDNSDYVHIAITGISSGTTISYDKSTAGFNIHRVY